MQLYFVDSAVVIVPKHCVRQFLLDPFTDRTGAGDLGKPRLPRDICKLLSTRVLEYRTGWVNEGLTHMDLLLICATVIDMNRQALYGLERRKGAWKTFGNGAKQKSQSLHTMRQPLCRRPRSV